MTNLEETVHIPQHLPTLMLETATVAHTQTSPVNGSLLVASAFAVIAVIGLVVFCVLGRHL